MAAHLITVTLLRIKSAIILDLFINERELIGRAFIM
jgi:hypothetical protein